MKITVKIDNVKIVVDEQNYSEKTPATLKYSDHNRLIQDIIKVMAEQCLRLRKVTIKEETVDN